jgi:hypothetical protein
MSFPVGFKTPIRQARSELLYRLRYPGRKYKENSFADFSYEVKVSSNSAAPNIPNFVTA